MGGPIKLNKFTFLSHIECIYLDIPPILHDISAR